MQRRRRRTTRSRYKRHHDHCEWTDNSLQIIEGRYVLIIKSKSFDHEKVSSGKFVYGQVRLTTKVFDCLLTFFKVVFV